MKERAGRGRVGGEGGGGVECKGRGVCFEAERGGGEGEGGEEGFAHKLLPCSIHSSMSQNQSLRANFVVRVAMWQDSNACNITTKY